MDINLFSQNNTTNPIISVDTDAEKFQKIVTLLCEKRKKLEETPSEENNSTLQELIVEMKTFGISEIDYQKYLALQNKSKSS